MGSSKTASTRQGKGIELKLRAKNVRIILSESESRDASHSMKSESADNDKSEPPNSSRKDHTGSGSSTVEAWQTASQQSDPVIVIQEPASTVFEPLTHPH